MGVYGYSVCHESERMMKAWRSIESIVARFVLAILLMGLVFSVPLAVMAAIHGMPAQAAQPAPPTVTPCQLVNTFEAISVARCQPENGVSYLINSHGFMLLEE